MDRNGIGLDEVTGGGYSPVCTRQAVEGVGLNEIPGEFEYSRILEQQVIQESNRQAFRLNLLMNLN